MRFLHRFLLASTIGAAFACEVAGQTPSTPSGAGGDTQAPVTKVTSVKRDPVATPTKALNERRFEFQIDNLRLAEAVEILRDQIPDLNVVVPPSLSEISIGPLKLRNVTLDGLIRAIPAATDGQVEAVFDGDAYLSFARNPDPNTLRPQSVCRVLSLRHYLDGKEGKDANRAIDDLTEVVTMACNHLERARKGAEVKTPNFSVHPATKLLIAVGSPEAVAIVEEVVSAVTGGTSRPGPAGGGFPGMPGMGGMGSGFGPGYDAGSPFGYGGAANPPGTQGSAGPNAFLPGVGAPPPPPQKPTIERR